MSTLSWPRDLPVADGTLRRARPDDAEALAALMAEPEVDRWWHQAWPAPRWAAHLADLTRHGSLPLVLTEGRTVMGYAEVYVVADDVLGDHVDHLDRDLGVHLALSEAARGRGHGPALLSALRGAAGGLLEGCLRLLAEPDERNTRSHAAFRKAGFETAGTVRLPGKTALLVVAEVAR